MWLEPLSQLLVSMALVSQAWAATSTTMPDPILTRQPVFAIPFRVDGTDDPSRQPVEVQLYVSTDRGAHWQLYAKATPAQQQFMIRTGGDGEYWFAIRTVDRAGQTRPETITGPSLRVLVDTKDHNAGLRPVDVSVRQQTPAKTRNSDKRVTDTSPPALPDPKGSVAIAINPAVAGKYAMPTGPSGNGGISPGLPPGERPRMVNSRRFELEYDVDSVGPSGIGRVELWGTRDAGKTWRSFAVDNNHRSPLLVTVDEEGIYGFRVVVTNGIGLGGKPPQSGDLPDLWVGVDFTKPTARIISARQGVDAEAGQLIISWQADDKWLAARPVSLSFSQTRTGPWLPVASGLENTGRYAWPIDNRMPSQFYLRLEVRDEAGNIGVHETLEPVTIDQSRPTIRIREVRPLGQTGARPVQ